MTAVLLAGMLALLPAQSVSAARDAARGREIAAIWCSTCHQIGPSFPAHGPGPPFEKIAHDMRYSVRYIKDWVTYPHATMPNFRLSKRVLDDLVSYIHSLRDTETAECILCNLDLPDRLFASGTGFFLNRRGDVLTVGHNVRSCSRITVELPGTFKGEAKVIDADQNLDLALLGTAYRPAYYAGIRHRRSLEPGEDVAVFSYPLQRILATEGNLSLGYVSALKGIGDSINEFQMSASLQPGSSGGPVFDRRGHVVGIARSRFVATSAKAVPPQGVNFAVNLRAIHLFLSVGGHPHSDQFDGHPLSFGQAVGIAKKYTVKAACWR